MATRCCSTRRCRAASMSGLRISREGSAGRGVWARWQEATSLCSQHRLSTIADIQRFEYCAHMCLDCAFRDIECTGDLFVAAAAAEHRDHLELSQCECA